MNDNNHLFQIEFVDIVAATTYSVLLATVLLMAV